MTLRQADILEAYLCTVPGVEKVSVYDRTCDAVIEFTCPREAVTTALAAFSYAQSEALAPEHSSRELNREFEDKLVFSIGWHYFKKFCLPLPIRTALTALKGLRYLWKGLRCLVRGKIQVPVLDATAIGVSMLQGDFNTASSIMFLLGVGDILDEWTHKKSVADLAQSMALGVDKVWLETPEGERVLVPTGSVRAGDRIAVGTGGMIALDGKVVSGEAMVNQASITGEPLAVRRGPGTLVYAGTVVEEGDCVIEVTKVSGSGRYDRIVKMIEESEKLKSNTENRAAALADRLVPYSLGATGLVYLLTRNVTKALAVLMVDFSCALKLSMPIAVLSAMREAGRCHLSVKGGRFLEAVAEADTIVFDKTGTLTHAAPRVAQIVTFGGNAEDEMLRLAACLEEHYPHSMARAVAGVLAAVICIEDPLRDEAAEVVRGLHELGFSKIVMMTGDSERTARAVAASVGVDEYYSEVLPEDKAAFIRAEHEAGRRVVMLGDGMNDSPALSEADAGIAIRDGAAIAREVADITIGADDLRALLTLRRLSAALTARIRSNYRGIIGFNFSLIVLGVAGVLAPATTAWLHNISTICFSLHAMTDLLEKDDRET